VVGQPSVGWHFLDEASERKHTSDDCNHRASISTDQPNDDGTGIGATPAAGLVVFTRLMEWAASGGLVACSDPACTAVTSEDRPGAYRAGQCGDTRRDSARPSIAAFAAPSAPTPQPQSSHDLRHRAESLGGARISSYMWSSLGGLS
jgi:hypothetical protein